MKKSKKNLPVIGIFIGMTFLVYSLSVGFAAMSSTLSISGIASFSDEGTISITNVTLYDSLNDAVEITPATYNNLTMSTNYNLPNSNSQITYEITVENNTEQNQIYNGFTVIKRDVTNITGYEVGISEGEVINKNSSKTFIITMYYYNEVVRDITIASLDILFLFEGTDKVNNIVSDSLLLSLNGKDRIYNNTWYDRSHNKDVELVNVTSDLNNNAYTFSGSNSCALTNRTVIPITGDFTLEVQITTGSSVSGDKSILAQEIMGQSREAGRTKPFNVFTEGTHNLRMFLIGSVNNITIVNNYVTDIRPNTSYHLLVTRSGANLSLYLNGYLVNESTIDINDALSSGTTQIGCYDATNQQNYIGNIHALRIYNRVLSTDEIIQNFSSNKIATELEGTLVDYAINNQLTVEGDGLYYSAENDSYVYKGLFPDNYLLLGGDLYRILSIESNNTLKITKINDIFSEIPFDESGYRTTASNPYCTSASTIASDSDYYGCNAWGIHSSMFGNEDSYTTQEASLVSFLNNDIYYTLNEDTQARIIESDFDVGFVSSSKLTDIIAEEKALKWHGKIGTLTVSDALNAGFNNDSTVTDSDNYVFKMSNSNLFLWTMNGKKSNTYDVMTIVNGNTISQRRSTRTSQVISNDQTAYFGAVPVFYIDGNLNASGDGTIETPFVFSQ